MADPSPTDPPTEVDPMAAARAVVVALEAVADLFASMAMQANRLAGVLDASIDPDTLVDVTLVDAHAAQARREADEIERRLAEDDRTEVIRVGPAGGELRFPRP